MNDDPNDWASEIHLNNLSNNNEENKNEENTNQVHGSNENTPNDYVNSMEEDDGNNPRLIFYG